MAITISIAIQKGGAGKTTTTGILAYMLSQRGYKVLAIDMDSQGNLTEMLTGVEDIYIFKDLTVLDAIKNGLTTEHLVKVDENLDIIPANDLLASYSGYITATRIESRAKIDWNMVLASMLEPVQDMYDFILIDTPPALSEQTLHSITASDYVIAMFETSKFCLSALPRMFETYVHIKSNINPKVKMLGICRTLIDSRRADNKLLIELVDEALQGLCFQTVIKRTAQVGRISLMGFKENTELNRVLSVYEELVEEIIGRMSQGDEYFESLDNIIGEYLLQDMMKYEKLREEYSVKVGEAE